MESCGMLNLLFDLLPFRVELAILASAVVAIALLVIWVVYF